MSPDQLGEIAKQGLLGFLLVLAIGAIIYLFKSREALQAARMADWREIAETVRANSIVMRDWVSANESRTRALEAASRAHELSAQAQTMLASEITQLGTTIRDAKQSNVEVREALLSKGLTL